MAIGKITTDKMHRAVTRRYPSFLFDFVMDYSVSNVKFSFFLAMDIVMDMSSCRLMGASVARLVILISGARSRSWN